MKPVVTSVREQNTLGKNGQIQKSIILTYTVGPHGPFTLITTAADIANKTAQKQMQDFANTLATLPISTS